MKARVAILISFMSFLVGARGEMGDDILSDLTGVGLEMKAFKIRADAFELVESDVEAHVFQELKDAKVRLLSDIEMDVMPGQPFLEVGVDVAHAQGPSHIFVVELELREMARLERPKDRVVSMAVSTWERRTIGIANRPEAILEALDRLIRLFADQWLGANYED